MALEVTETPPDRRALKSAKKGSKVHKRFGKPSELRAALARLKGLLARNKSDYEAAQEMGLGTQAYNELKREMYRQETSALYSQTTEEIYIDYVMAQRSCVSDLQRLIANLETSNQHNALVGAIRARSDIQDKIIKVGQEMGILEKAPERKMVLHGVAVAKLDNQNLRRLIAGELEGLAAVVQKFGDTDLLGNPIAAGPAPAIPAVAVELPPGPAFTGSGKPQVAMGGPKKRDAAKKARFMERVKAVAPANPEGVGSAP